MPLSAGSKKRAQQRHGATRAAGYNRWHVAARLNVRRRLNSKAGNVCAQIERKKERREVVEGANADGVQGEPCEGRYGERDWNIAAP